MREVTILGSGMAGFGAAYRLHSLGIPSVMYEKNAYHGGHTSSFTFENGFVFDEGPHVSFTKDRRIQDLLADSVDQKYEVVPYNVNNYWQGYWIKHPAHCNLHGLPTKLVVDIIRDFVAVHGATDGSVRNYEEWLVRSYGNTFARTFPMQYTRKYHTTEANNMSTDWLGPRMYQPSLEEVLTGALTKETPNVHYVTEFRYPSYNGFVSYFTKFLPTATLKLGHEVSEIDPEEKSLTFAHGGRAKYRALVSSLPLPELIRRIKGVPPEISAAAEQLSCSSCVVVNIGIGRERISDAHISYFYDPDIVFTRLSFPSLMSRHNAPEGACSVQAEIYYSRKYRPLEHKPETYADLVVADLRRVGLLQETDPILFQNVRIIPYANVIFDLERARALALVHGYLDEIGIAYCGRYGKWAYIWTDEAFISGEEAAQRVCDSPGNPYL